MPTKKKTIEETYQKLTQREHVLHRPGMYIGETKMACSEVWVFDKQSCKMVKRAVEYSPGFLKVFDEVLTNATDHATRDPTVNTIKVEFDNETGVINVWNNGAGVPVIEHREHKMYVPELIFGHLLAGSNYDDNDQRTGSGVNGVGVKCLLHSTMVPLFNGQIKKASELQLGDYLIGDDGKPRKILTKQTGYGEMYRVKQHLGDDYIVNDNHILTLHMPDHKVIFWNNNSWKTMWWNNDKKCIETKMIKVFDKKVECQECGMVLSGNIKRHYRRQHKDKLVPTFERRSPTYADMKNADVVKKLQEMKEFVKTMPFESTFDINIQDYLKLNKTTQRRLAGIRGECVQWECKDVELDPYVLGLWLGDGMKDGRKYACNGKTDNEIIASLEEWCQDNDAVLKQFKNGVYSYYIHSASNFGKKGSSPLRSILKKYNLIDNKHIPKDYIINSRETRLKVLAGLIDTDGIVSRDGTRVSISQSHIHKRLVDDIVFLARSLGFCCTVRQFVAKYTIQNGDKRESDAYRINISGNIEDIPTLLPSKKCKNTKIFNTDKTTGYIKIEKVDNDHYIGLGIDGNQRFVINDFTVTHNCANIFSKEFTIETIDSERGLKFVQKFYDNMEKRDKPKVTKNSGKSYTKVTFLPDYQKFGMKGLDDDTVSLICKRVYDCIVCTSPNVSVYLNGEKLKGKGLQEYVKYFFDDSESSSQKVFYENASQTIGNGDKRTELTWEYAIVPWNQFEHVSFVNGNSTYQGGKHVDNVMYQITNKLQTLLTTKKKVNDVKPAMIREKMFLFLRATVINPHFNSQTKEYLTTQVKDFGCKVDVSDKFIDKIWKSTIIDDIVQLCKAKESLELARSTDGKKKSRIIIPKLEDALWAGTARSDLCTLILTEGDSAKTFAMWGRSIVGAEKFAVFPLKGKVLNVRDATVQQLINNEEINNLKQIIGLKQGKDYQNTSDLRYGKVMLLTDADVDGSHIKALLVNFFHAQWPSLLKLNFLQTLRTPIIKAIKGNKVIEFFTEQDYNKWKDSVNVSGYRIRYFKGLGTSQKQDAQETFKKIDNLKIDYFYKDKKCDESILLAFEKEKNVSKKAKVAKDTATNSDGQTTMIDTVETKKSCTDKRKTWLSSYDKNIYIGANEKKVSYHDLIHKELIHFSIYDNTRSIPNLCDGLKPSQRKILYYMLNKNITKSIKVAQLSGYVSAETGYHHGEASLQQAIIGMGQNFIGSNNINLLYPDGNFGSRLLGGKDAASPRYIYTHLCQLTPHIFNTNDTPLLNVQHDDGDVVEPEWYIPVLPMVLVNGCDGIGTGYSTHIPPHNPKDIIANILRVMDDSQPLPMEPFFKGFKGDVISLGEGSYVTKGKWEKMSEGILRVTELPIGMWVTQYKEFLETLIEETAKKTQTSKHKVVLKDVKNKTSDENDGICFDVYFKDASVLDKLIDNGTLEKELKLIKAFNTNNMYLFDDTFTPSKYKTTNDILLDFYDIRLEFYGKRKAFLIRKYEKELSVLQAKVRFIDEYISGKLDINRKSKDFVLALLEENGFPKHSSESDDSNKKSYDYLTKMSVISFTKERIEELEKQTREKLNQLNELKEKSEKQLWKDDLNSIQNLLE